MNGFIYAKISCFDINVLLPFEKRIFLLEREIFNINKSQNSSLYLRVQSGARAGHSWINQIKKLPLRVASRKILKKSLLPPICKLVRQGGYTK